MRVLHLNTYASGGSYEYATLLSHALVGEGIDSRVLCKNSRAEGARFFLNRLIRRASVSLSREPWHGTRRLLQPPVPGEFAEADIVHLHTVADWFDVPRWLETLPTNVVVVISLHDMWHFTGGCFLYRGCNLYSDTCAPCPILKTPLNRVLAKDEQRRKLQAYRSRRVRFVANSRWLAGLAEQSPIVRACGGARVIPPGIDTAVFKPQNKAECRAELAIPADSFVIAAGAASLTDENKNIPWLLDQLSRVPTAENVMVALAGEGTVPVPNGVNVRFVGNLVNRRERARVFAAADVFVSASLMETYGLTLIEAMACGTPVVAFRVGGIPEAAPDGQGAIVCDRQDSAAVIEAVTKLRDAKQLRESLGNAGYQIVHTRNGLRSFAQAFMCLYEECIPPARTPFGGRSALAA
jgi:glycosyltransferase involved in cell wall biosynthesis